MAASTSGGRSAALLAIFTNRRIGTKIAVGFACMLSIPG